MFPLQVLEPVDYLLIGHLTCDLVDGVCRLGGTAAYAALTADALGLKVGIVTSFAADLNPAPLGKIPVISYPSEQSTKFENCLTPTGRVQILHSRAEKLDFHLIPEVWRNAPIVHLAPVAQEVESSLLRYFPAAFIGVTPQGWLRAWDSSGRVEVCEWPEMAFVLQNAGAAVISLEDVGGDEGRIEEMAASCRVLAVTEAGEGSRIYWNGDVRRIRPLQTEEVDATGAGDIYAAAFFARLYQTRDPWEAARFATGLASASVKRYGLAGIPTPEEIQDCLVEVL
ncbi:MAG: PfkB family carbohydrate kinase [Anaerolineales bacterium]|nr:PfkB family carbohydrate kinase [Anaerolineales bacterium]